MTPATPFGAVAGSSSQSADAINGTGFVSVHPQTPGAVRR